MICKDIFSDCAQQGIEYLGGDIFTVSSDNAMQCPIACEKNEHCKGWSFREGPRTCVLMRDVHASKLSSKYHISGFRNSGTDICGKNGNYLTFAIS